MVFELCSPRYPSLMLRVSIVVDSSWLLRMLPLVRVMPTRPVPVWNDRPGLLVFGVTMSQMSGTFINGYSIQLRR